MAGHSKSSRPKGYADWSPSPEVAHTLQQVRAVLLEYRDYLPLTNRQIFYRLVGASGFEKTEKAYKRLCNYLTRARRAGIIPFSAIRDDKVASLPSLGWDDIDEYKESIRESAEDFTLDRQKDQEVYTELWCEAEGMLPQMARVASDYHISCYSAGGFLSVTATHDIAKRIVRRDKPTVLLHVGDYDPSGESIFDTIALDVASFVIADLGYDPKDFCDADEVMAQAEGLQFRPQRIALTREQVERHNLPTAPPKSTDSRSAAWVGRTAQAEAMPPDLLAETVRFAIEQNVDLDLLDEVNERTTEYREKLVTWLEDLS